MRRPAPAGESRQPIRSSSWMLGADRPAPPGLHPGLRVGRPPGSRCRPPMLNSSGISLSHSGGLPMRFYALALLAVLATGCASTGGSSGSCSALEAAAANPAPVHTEAHSGRLPRGGGLPVPEPGDRGGRGQGDRLRGGLRGAGAAGDPRGRGARGGHVGRGDYGGARGSALRAGPDPVPGVQHPLREVRGRRLDGPVPPVQALRVVQGGLLPGSHALPDRQ